MSMPKPQSADPEMTAILQELLEQPFAISHDFGQLTLEEAGKTIENTGEELLAGENVMRAEEKASFDRCRELYCTVLLSLDDSHTLPNENLYDLAHRDNRTLVFTAPPPLRPSQES